MSISVPSSVKPFSVLAAKSLDSAWTTLVSKTNSSTQILIIESMRICNTEFGKIKVEFRGNGFDTTTPFLSVQLKSDMASVPIQAEAPIYLNDNQSIEVKVSSDGQASNESTKKVFIYITGWEMIT